jgi:MFS family permease
MVQTIQGFTNALLYVGESTAMLSYPTAQDRGKYLGIWTSMRNAGSIVGGAINFGNNHTNSSAGGVAWSTYLIFVGFEASGLIFASLLTQTKKVRRADGTRVPTSVDRSWRAEFVALWRHIQNPRVNLLAICSDPSTGADDGHPRHGSSS